MLEIKGTRRHWQDTGCGPFQSVAMEKGPLEEAQAVRALRPWPPADGSSEMKSHETLRFFEIDVYDLVNGALNGYSLLNQPG